MTMLNIYHLRAENPDVLWAMLETASAGKAQPFAWQDAAAERLLDESRVMRPVAETVAGAEQEVTDPMSGETIILQPQTATGFWRSDVVLADETDADLAAIAEEVSSMEEA